MAKRKVKKEEGSDLRGRTIRLGNIELRTHVAILDGWKSDKAGKIKDLITHQDDTVWALEKIEKDSTGREHCFTLANVEFKDRETQEEYDLISIGSRLVEDVEAEDLANLKKIVRMIDEHCHWMHEERFGLWHTPLCYANA